MALAVFDFTQKVQQFYLNVYSLTALTLSTSLGHCQVSAESRRRHKLFDVEVMIVIIQN